jgi:hypothetical protein
MSERLEALTQWRVRFDILVERYSAWPFFMLAIFVVFALVSSTVARETRAQIDAQRAALQQQLAMAPARLPDTAPAITRRGAPPAWDVLPAVDRYGGDLKALFQLARQRGLLVAQADYARSADAEASVEAVQLTLPLNGPYPQLRRFAEDALRAMPHLSIDQIAFERGAIASAAIAARIKLTLWYRADRAAPWVSAASTVRAIASNP